MAEILGAIKKGFGLASKSLGLVLVLFAFNLILNLVSMPFAVTPGAVVTPEMGSAAVIFSIIFILLSVFFQGASLGVVRDIIKEGHAQLGKFASYGLKYYIRLLVLGILIILIVAVTALIAGIIIAITSPLNNAVVTTIAAVIAIAIAVAVGLLYFIPLMISPYVLVSEESGVIASMKKSLEVIKKPFSRAWALLLLFVLLVLISLGVGFVLGFIVGLISTVIPAGAGKVLMAIITSIINSYLGVVMIGSFMTFYLALTRKIA